MFSKIFSLKKINNYQIYAIIIFISASVSYDALINPQLHGDDEATTFVTALNLLNSLKEFDIFSFFKSLLGANHPPGRYLLPIPFISLFGDTIISARLPYFLIWIYSCVLSFQIGNKIFDKQVAFITAIFLSCSGLFSIEIQSLGLGATVLFGFLLIRELSISQINLDLLGKNKKSLFKINLYLFLSFIFFSTWILMILSFYIFLFSFVIKSNDIISNLKKFISKNILFFLIYIFYYSFFIGIPFWIVNFNGLEVINSLFNKEIMIDLTPFGQYHQHVIRVNNTVFLGFGGLIENFKHLNWYFLPIIGPTIFLISIISIFKFKKDIFYVFLAYLIVFNFILGGRAGPHLQALFIIMFPFGIYQIKIILSKLKISNFLFLCKFILLISTTYFFNLKHYNEINYPYNFEKIFFAKSIWPQNLKRPLDDIVLKIKENSSLKKPVFNLIDGSIQLYHGRDLIWYKKNKITLSNSGNICIKFNKEKYNTIVNSKKQIPICKDKNLKNIFFKNSYLYIVTLKK